MYEYVVESYSKCLKLRCPDELQTRLRRFIHTEPNPRLDRSDFPIDLSRSSQLLSLGFARPNRIIWRYTSGARMLTMRIPEMTKKWAARLA